MSRTTIPDSWSVREDPPHLEEGLTDLQAGLAAAVAGGGVGEQLMGLGVGEQVLGVAQLLHQRA